MNVCIIGTGYVGLVTAACLSEMGNHVRCVDKSPQVVETLRAGSIHIFEPGLEELVRRNCAEGRLVFTTSLAEGLCSCGVDAEFAFVCVGTPSGDDGVCDLCYVDAVAEEIGRTMSGGHGLSGAGTARGLWRPRPDAARTVRRGRGDRPHHERPAHRHQQVHRARGHRRPRARHHHARA